MYEKKNGTKVEDNQKLLMNVYLTKAVNENDAYDRFQSATGYFKNIGTTNENDACDRFQSANGYFKNIGIKNLE